MHLFSLTCGQFTTILQERWGRGQFHATGAYRRVLKHGSLDIGAAPEFSTNPGLAREISSAFDLSAPAISEVLEDSGSVKIVFALADGTKVEAVWLCLPRRTTLCISCQAGCRMGCAFCRTGSLGFSRNLLAEEIVGQVWAVRHVMDRPVDNIVFMGMGEPLDNLYNVAQSIRVLSDQQGFDIPHSRITVSTAGPAGGIQRLGRLNWPRLNLAVSLNAAHDRLRSELMPVNRTCPLAALKKALLEYPLRRRGVFFVEYVLLKGVNDSAGHAAELAGYLKELPVRLNVIGYNPGSGTAFESPDEQECRIFCTRMAEAGVFVRLRSSRGQALLAGCGQLGSPAIKS